MDTESIDVAKLTRAEAENELARLASVLNQANINFENVKFEYQGEKKQILKFKILGLDILSLLN